MNNQEIILVIEDEQPLANIISDKLSQRGFEVVTARTVQQAINYLKDISDIKLIWLDHYLIGDKNGLNLVAELKHEKSEWRQIPIFLVSNSSGLEKQEAYMTLGVDKYYVKSNYALSDIIEDVEKYLRD